MKKNANVIFGLCLAVIPVTAADGTNTNYVDGFEGQGINGFWTLQQTSGKISLSSEQHHTGSQSLKMQSASGGQREIHLTHTFPSPFKGSVSVYIYDVNPGQETLYQRLSLNNSKVTYPNGYAQLGIQDFDASCYMAAYGNNGGPNQNCGIYPQASTTAVHRTAGWHLLTINFDTSAVTFLIDSNSVYTVNGDYQFDTIDIFMSELKVSRAMRVNKVLLDLKAPHGLQSTLLFQATTGVPPIYPVQPVIKLWWQAATEGSMS